VSGAAGVEKHQNGVSGRSEISENLTSEADFEESIAIRET